MKIAVVGSRSFTDYSKLVNVLNGVSPSLIISGGADGADQLAERYARENNIPVQIFLPDWNQYGRAAGPIRNKLIVENADLVIAFWDGSSPGTRSSINLANSMNKDCRIIQYC